MRFTFTAHGPIVANDRMGAFKTANGLIEEIEKRTGSKFLFTLHGPFDNDERDDEDRRTRADEQARDIGQASHPGDDFPEDDASSGGGSEGTGSTDGLQRSEPAEGSGDGGEKPRRGRGRPPGSRNVNSSAEASGKATAGPERSTSAGNARGTAEARDGNGHGRAPEGKGTERGGADEGARSSRAASSAAVGDRGGDQGQAGVMSDMPSSSEDDGMDFNDPEPTLSIADINRALTELYRAMGDGATPKHVKDALGSIAGVTQPRDVPEEGYAKVIREIEAMTAKYKSGKLSLKRD